MGELLGIGQVAFDIAMTFPRQCLPLDPRFEDFFRISCHDMPVIKISVTTGILSEYKLGTPLFVQGENWSIGGNHTMRIVDFSPTPNCRPLWRANFELDMANVCVTIDETHPVLGRSGVLPNPMNTPLDQLLLMYALAHHHGVMLHASAVDFDGHGILFLGRSGVGKTTIAKQFQISGCKSVIGDDRLVLREISSGFMICGTPWASARSLSSNVNVPLKNLYFLQQGPVDSLRLLSPTDAFERLLQVASAPWGDQAFLDPILTTLEKLASTTPAYLLCCQKGRGVVNLIRQHIADSEKVPA